MAHVWQQRVNGNHYEVRNAGRTLRLYTNGICHTDYNPDRAVTRSIWDLLFLPALLLPAEQPLRVLLLGVGGGSVIQLLQRHLRPQWITGIELSGTHLMIARRFFKLRGDNLILYEAEAGEWLSNYDGPPFDLIIDDLFLEEGSEALRAIDMDHTWMQLLLNNLTPAGILAVNFAGQTTFRQCAWFKRQTLRRRLPSVFALRTPYLDNVVGAFARTSVETRRLRQRLSMLPQLERARRRGQLRYHIRKLPAYGP